MCSHMLIKYIIVLRKSMYRYFVDRPFTYTPLHICVSMYLEPQEGLLTVISIYMCREKTSSEDIKATRNS